MATTAPIQGEIEEPENSSCEVFQTTGIGVKTPEVEESQSDNILFQTVDSSMKTLEVVSAANANSSVGEIENFEHENFKKSSLEGEAATDVALTEKKFENELTLPRDQFGLPSKTNDPVKDDKAYESIEEKDAVITKDERLLVSEKKNTTKDERTETKEIETANEPVSNGQSLDEFENSSRNDEDAKEVIQTEHFAVDFEEADIKYKDMSALDPKENEKLDSNKDEKPVSKIMHETHNKDLEDHINQALKGQSFDCETGRGNTEIAEIEQLVNNNRQEDAIFSLVDKQDCHADQNLISERSKENSDGPCDGSPDAKIFEEQTFQGNSSQIEEVGTSATEPVMDKAIEKSLLQCEEVNIPSEAATEGNITSKGIDSANSCRVGPQEEDSEKEGFGLSETTNEMEEENEKVVETVVGNIEQISALEKFETENEKDTSVEDTDSQNETLKANGSLAEETENEQLANVSPLTNDNPIALIDSTSPSEPELEASVEEKKHDKESTPARVEERLNESMEINYSLGGTLVVEEKVDDVSAKDDNHSIERSDSEMEGNITETAMSLLEAKGQNDQTNSEKNAGTSGFSKEKGEEKYDFSCATPKVLKEDVNCTTDTKHDTPGDGISNECSDVTLDLREQIKEETEEKGEGTSTITEDQNYKTMETNNDSYGEKEEKDRVIELKKEENNADGEIMGPADYGLDSEDKLDNVYVGKEDSAQSLQNGETANKDKSCESNEIPNESMEDEISMMDDDAKPILHDPTDIGLQREEKDKEHIGEAVQQQIGTADIPQSERDCKTNTVDAACSTDAEGPTECYHASEINITPAKEINKEFSEMHAQSSDFEKSEQIQGGSEPKEDNVEKTKMQFESASKGSNHGSSYERELSKIDINAPVEKINNAPTLYASKDTGVFSSTETIEHIKGTKGAVENIIISASVEGEESANVGETCEENLQLIDGDTQICDHEYPLESIKKLEYTGTFDKQTDVDTSKVATVEGLTEKNVHIEDASSSEQHYAEMKEACKRPYTEDSIVQDKELQVDEGLTTANTHESVEEQRTEERNNQKNIDMNLVEDEQAEQIFQGVEENHEDTTPKRVTEDQRLMGYITNETTKLDTEKKDQDSGTTSSVTEVDISFSNKEDEESQTASAAMSTVEDNSTKELVGEKHDMYEKEPIKSTQRNEVEMLTKDFLPVPEDQQTDESKVGTKLGRVVMMRCEEISEQFPIEKDQKLNQPTTELEIVQQDHKISTEEVNYVFNDEEECTSPEDLKVKGDNQSFDKEHIVNPKDWVQQDDMTIDDVILHSGVEDKSFDEGDTTDTKEAAKSKEVKASNASSEEKTIETMTSTTTEVACCMTEEDAEKLSIAQVVREKEASYGTEIASQHIMEERETMQVQNSKPSANESVEEQYPQTNVKMNPGKDEQVEHIVHEDVEEHDEGITPQRLLEEQSLMDHLADDHTKVDTEEKDLASSTVSSVIEGDISFSNKEDEESQAASAAMTTREDSNAKEFVDEKHDKEEEEPITSIEKNEVETLTKDYLSVYEEQQTHEREAETEVRRIVTTSWEEISEQFPIKKEPKSSKPTIEMEVEKQNRQENIEDTIYEANDEGECTSPEVLKVEGDNQAFDKEHIDNPKDWVKRDDITIDNVTLQSGFEDKSFEEGHTTMTREEGESKEVKAYDATSKEKTIETMISTTTEVACCMNEDDAEKLKSAPVIRKNEASYGTEIVSQHIMEERETMHVQNSEASKNESVEEQYPQTNVDINPTKRDEQAEQIVQEDVEEHDEGITPQRVNEDQRLMGHLADDPTKVDTGEKYQDSSTISSVTEGDISISNKEDKENQAALAAMTLMPDNNAKEFVDEKHDNVEDKPIKYTERNEVVTTQYEAISEYFPLQKEEKLNKPTIELEVKQQIHKTHAEEEILVANDEGECTSPEDVKVKGDNQALDEEHMDNPDDWIQQDDTTNDNVIHQVGVEDKSCEAGQTSNIRDGEETNEVKASSSASTEKTTKTTSADVAYCTTEEDTEKLNAQLISKNEFQVDETRQTPEKDRHDDMKMGDEASGPSAQDRRYPTREEILDELNVVGIVEKIEEHDAEKELDANDIDTKLSKPEMVDEDKGPDDASTQLDPDKQNFEEAATASTMKSIDQPETEDTVSEFKDENFEANLAANKTSLNGDQDDAYMTSDKTNITTSLAMMQGPEGEVGETDKHELVKEQIEEEIELNRETESLKLDLELDDLIFGGKEFPKDEKDVKQLQEEMANLEVSQIEVTPMGKWKDGETFPEVSTVQEEEPSCKDNEDGAIEENKEIDLNGETAECSNYKDDTTTVVAVEAEVTEENEAARKFEEASNLAPETKYDETTTAEGTISDGSFAADKLMHTHITSISALDTTDLGDTSVPLQDEEKINKPSAVLINEPSYKDKEADGIIKEDKEENKVGRKLEEAPNLATETESEESIFADKTCSEYPPEETSISYGLVEVGRPKDNNFSVSACESTNEGSVECKEKLTDVSEVLTEEPNDKENKDEIAGEDKKPDLRIQNVIYEVDNEVKTNLTQEKTEENMIVEEIEASSLSPEKKSAETASTDKKIYSEFPTAEAFVSESATADALVSESTTADAFVSEGLTEEGNPKDEQNSSISADETTVMGDITKQPENKKFMDASRVFVEEPSYKEKIEGEFVEQYEEPSLVCRNQASSEERLVEKEKNGKLEQQTNEESPILEMPDDHILQKDDEKLEEISYSKFKETNEAEDELNFQSTSQTEEEKHEDGNKEQEHSLLLMLEKQGHMERSKMKEAEELTEQASVEEENQVNYLGKKEEETLQACDHTTEATLETASSTHSLHHTMHQTVDLEEQEVKKGLEGGNIEQGNQGKNTIKDMEIDAEVLTENQEAVSSDVCPFALTEMSASEASPKREEMEETGAQKDVSESKPAVELDVGEEKTDDEKEHETEPEHKIEESGTGIPIMVEASREADTKPSPKKSHNLLSGVGSKVKHSISKVKKAITGKSSHPKTPSTSK